MRILVAIALCAGLWGFAPVREAGAQSSMPSFSSDAELRRFLTRGGDLAIAVPPPPPPPAPIAPAPTASPMASAPSAPSAPSASDNPSITSTQIVGVDEGGIVKVSGDYLVILRRGRLFSVSTADGDIAPIHMIDAYPPGVEARGDWYDEMLISGDLIVVVGYSYRRGGTEINRFRIGRDGRFTFVDSHHLRSNDYYSSRNYASRLIGSQLVVYTPLYFQWDKDPMDALPAFSRWEPGQERPQWRRIATGRQVFLPTPMRRAGPTAVEAMHTVSRCDLTRAELSCTSTVVLGPSSRTFFVSQNAVYVWVNYTWQRQDQPGYLYRIPLDGGRPSAAQVRGGPVDQFSFHPNAAESRLDVLVASRAHGDEMWAPEFAGGRPALLRLPTSRFGDGSRGPRANDYLWLPGGENTHLSHNRFVNNRLLFAQRSWVNRQSSTRLVVSPLDGGPPTLFDMPGGVSRIEQIGQDALIVGSDDGATFTTIDLANDTPLIGSTFQQPGARESEARSHAFFYRADSADGANGVLGLPLLRNERAANGQWLTAEDMLFLSRRNRELADFGRLAATPSGRPDDGCQASCVDWYGNARPIFLRGRVFALMGYEIVEGYESGAQIREVRRVNYAPEPVAR